MRSFLLLATALLCLIPRTGTSAEAIEKTPVRLAIVGLVHGHVRGFIPAALARRDVQLVGIVESNRELADRSAKQFKLDPLLFFTRIEDLLAAAKVDAVAVFTNTFDHRKIVETCAAHGVHVMMEKPLAVSVEHARAMAAAAKKGGIPRLSD